jgi:hypothetical protein
MYVRFITPERLRARVSAGLFGAAYDCRDDAAIGETLRVAIELELDWFADYLPRPDRRCFLVRSRKVWLPDGICWFRAEARAMIAHAFALGALLRECGVLVTKVATRSPGQILYRDAWQIVAKPEAATPTLWR